MARMPVLRQWLQDRVDQRRRRGLHSPKQLCLGDYLFPEDHDDLQQQLMHHKRYKHLWHSAAMRTLRDQALMAAKLRRVSDEDEFQAIIDVHQFAPEELTVRVTGCAVTVEGKHEERSDEHGLVSRHFVRKYPLSEGYDTRRVVSLLSSDGVMVLKVPKLESTVAATEKLVPVAQTGKRHIEAMEEDEQQINGVAEEKHTKKLKI